MSSDLDAATSASLSANRNGAAQALPQRRAVIVAANKGGVGKSFATRAWIDLTRSTARRVSAWDLDGANGSLGLYYQDEDPIVGIGLDDVSSSSSTAWLDAMYSDADDVILDVPGGKTAALYQTFVGGPEDLITFIRDSERRIVLVSVIGTKKDSLPTIADAIETFDSSVEHVVLKNGFFGSSDEFIIFDGTTDDRGQKRFGKTRELAESARAAIVYLPKLSPATDAVLDEAGLSFAKGVDAATAIGRRHAFNVASWLKLVEKSYAHTPISIDGAAARHV